MRNELEEALVEEHPELYDNYKEPGEYGRPPPFAVYGFECGDGWYDLINWLSGYLDKLGVDIEVSQVKEKYGGLRFYHNGLQSDGEAPAYMTAGAVRLAEELSYNICEECGEWGELRGEGWLKTRCDDCYDG